MRRLGRLQALMLTLAYLTVWTIQGKMEYCPWEAFRAQCLHDEVLVIETARYGRMHLGRCVKNDLGYVGCFTDVQDLADGWCSGRQSCEIAIPNPELDNLKPCLEDLKSYFEVTYKCIKVATGEADKCQTMGRINLSDHQGYISNAITEISVCGSSVAPWRVVGEVGQTIELHLIDFAASPSYKAQQGDVERHCPVYATIREEGVTVGQTICGGRTKDRHIYTSVGNVLDIEIPLQQDAKKRFYLINYKITGCGNPNLSGAYWIKRKWAEASVGCKSSDDNWKLLCEDNRWIGKIGNCSQIAPKKEEASVWSFPLSTGATVAVIIGISLAMGGVILVVGVLYLRKSREEERNQMKACAPLEDMTYGHCMKAGHLHETRLAMSENLTNTRLSGMGDKDFIGNDCIPLHITQDTENPYGVHLAGTARVPYWMHDENCAKLYESSHGIRKCPVSPRQLVSTDASHCLDDPRYFDLEPSAQSMHGQSCMEDSGRPKPDLIGSKSSSDCSRPQLRSFKD